MKLTVIYFYMLGNTFDWLARPIRLENESESEPLSLSPILDELICLLDIIYHFFSKEQRLPLLVVKIVL